MMACAEGAEAQTENAAAPLVAGPGPTSAPGKVGDSHRRSAQVRDGTPGKQSSASAQGPSDESGLSDGTNVPSMQSVELPVPGLDTTVASTVAALPVVDPASVQAATQGGGAEVSANLSVRVSGTGSRGLSSTQQLQQSLGLGGKFKQQAQGQAGPASSEADAVGIVSQNSASRNDAGHDIFARMGHAVGAEVARPTTAMELVGSILSKSHTPSESRDADSNQRPGLLGTMESVSPHLPESTDALGGGLGADEVISEPVKFWLGTEQTQQADMTVDDVGGGPVDVTIRLHGKEAHVQFRADEAQARDALQAASGQLKDLLGQEGLTLSGLSVGTSGQGQAFGQAGQRDNQGKGGASKVGRVAVALNEDVSLAGQLPARTSNGRGVDLYV
ncbi:flagellar hook-length control protein FliK [Curvibacter sp. APW13]|uniref:flagellar hook-length control protein FliK n=1 Tax=Curvibacter sp. APW13 TaxID=3077236 RepID=UPI0028E078C2|nr:flagellar hook-length control protein FliK [Curvibacter sp. APW13]MDT8992907.1 flagellar hook-length control protein FliK [Curvibacter sp. APW13]